MVFYKPKVDLINKQDHKKLLNAGYPVLGMPFTVYDAQNNINANGQVRVENLPIKNEEVPKDIVKNKEEIIIQKVEISKKVEDLQKEEILNVHDIKKQEIVIAQEKKKEEIIKKQEEYKREEEVKIEKPIYIEPPPIKISQNSHEDNNEGKQNMEYPECETKFKPLPRVHTELNLSGSIEVANESHNPIIVEAEDSPNKETAFREEIKEEISNIPNPENKNVAVDNKIVPEIKSEGKVYKFVTGFSIRPRDDEEGEDACFTCERGLGVADGVSGWENYGINPAAFSRELMNQSEKMIRETTGLVKSQQQEKKASRIPRTASYVALDFQNNTVYEPQSPSNFNQKQRNGNDAENLFSRQVYITPINPMQILANAHERVLAIGSCTATIVVLNSNEMEAVNLGDSGYLCFSLLNNEYVITGMSKEQQHEFNVPYQLSKLPPPEYLTRMERENKSKEAKQLRAMIEKKKMCNDNPEEADQYTKEVAENDIYILGTDGFFDNLFSYEIKDIVRDVMRNAERITSRLAKVFIFIIIIINRN